MEEQNPSKQTPMPPVMLGILKTVVRIIWIIYINNFSNGLCHPFTVDVWLHMVRVQAPQGCLHSPAALAGAQTWLTTAPGAWPQPRACVCSCRVGNPVEWPARVSWPPYKPLALGDQKNKGNRAQRDSALLCCSLWLVLRFHFLLELLASQSSSLSNSADLPVFS